VLMAVLSPCGFGTVTPSVPSGGRATLGASVSLEVHLVPRQRLTWWYVRRTVHRVV
jgi:hypothetical protein